LLTLSSDANGAAAVYIIGRRKENLEAVAQGAKNGKIIPIVGDVTSKESLQAAAARVKGDYGYVNVVVANSGILGPKLSDIGIPTDGRVPTLEEFAESMWIPSMDDFTNTFHVNCTAALYTAMAFLPLLNAGNEKANVTQKSQIIITTSIAAFTRRPAAGYAYSASKAAVTHLAKNLATNLSPYKIRVNTIAPGPYPSDMTSDRAELNDVPASEIPLQRMGNEQDMAGIALFLCSVAGAYNNGNCVITDGGRLGLFPATY